jgi:hypothetical protein
MIDTGIIEKMNLVIDGVATPADKAKLDEYLAAHLEARSYYEALMQLAHRLDNDPMPEAPPGLEGRILEAIHDTPAIAPARTVEASTPWLKGFLSPKLRPWSTFGLGLAAGVFLLAAVQFGRPGFWDAARDINPSQVSGSMVPEGAPLASIPVETESGNVSGAASISASGNDVVVEVNLQSTGPVEWELGYDSDAWTLERIDRQGTAISAFAANRGTIQGLHTGEGRLTMTFAGSADAAERVVLRVLEGGQPVFEGTPSIHH